MGTSRFHPYFYTHFIPATLYLTTCTHTAHSNNVGNVQSLSV
jgi:hypothetical protein